MRPSSLASSARWAAALRQTSRATAVAWAAALRSGVFTRLLFLRGRRCLLCAVLGDVLAQDGRPGRDRVRDVQLGRFLAVIVGDVRGPIRNEDALTSADGDRLALRIPHEDDRAGLPDRVLRPRMGVPSGVGAGFESHPVDVEVARFGTLDVDVVGHLPDGQLVAADTPRWWGGDGGGDARQADHTPGEGDVLGPDHGR